MPKLSENKQYSIEISKRFFEAMDKILSSNEYGNLTAQLFGDSVGINSSNLNRIRNNPGEHFVTLEACALLCKVYGVSYAWLHGGIGTMKADEQTKADYSSVQNNLEQINKAAQEIQGTIKRLKKKKG